MRNGTTEMDAVRSTIHTIGERTMTIDQRVLGRVIGMGILLGVGACGGTPEADAVPQDSVETFARIINVEVETLGPQSFTSEIPLTGVVEANQDVMIAAEESGVIREIIVDKGRAVQEGDAIFRIDDRILRSQVDEARARANLAQETWERRKRLWEEDGVGTELAYLEARYSAEQAAASLAVLEERLERTIVRSPITGVLDSRLVEVGSMVATGTTVGRVVGMNPVKILAGVPERFAPDVRVGTEARIEFDVLPGETFNSRIQFVGVRVDPQNRTFPIEMLLGNPVRAIKPEMVAEIALITATLEDVIVVPEESLVRVEEGFVAFVVVSGADGDVAEARAVRLGPSRSDRVVIESGLEPGDRLITAGQTQVATGDRVRVVSQP